MSDILRLREDRQTGQLREFSDDEIIEHALSWAVDMLTERDKMNAAAHCQQPRLSPITELVLSAHHIAEKNLTGASGGGASDGPITAGEILTEEQAEELARGQGHSAPDSALGRCQVLLQCHRETGHEGAHEAKEAASAEGVDAKRLEAAAEAHYDAVWQGRRVPVPWADADDDIRSRHRASAAAVLIAAGVLQRSVRVACPVCGGMPGSTPYCPSCEQTGHAGGHEAREASDA